jgi:hypothetical protein
MAACVTGDADDAAETKKAPCFDIGSVLLPDMDAIAAGGKREIGPVVQQKGDAAALRYRT